jgi:hypothetical protein
VIIVTCESNPAEIDALRRLCDRCPAGHDADWELVRHLRPGQAAALPMTQEAQGRLVLFTVARRLTPHVRHRQKYVDVPVTEDQAFVFGGNGAGAPLRVRTLRQFVRQMERVPEAVIDPYVQRGDLSRWVRDVFGDYALAADLRAIESQHRAAPGPDTVPKIVDAVRSRYELLEEPLAAGRLCASRPSSPPSQRSPMRGVGWRRRGTWSTRCWWS